MVLAIICVCPAVNAVEPANPQATDDVRRVLNYLDNLKSRRNHGLLLGQDLGMGTSIKHGYQQFAEGIRQQTGDLPALIGGDYGLDANHTPSSTNGIFVKHWRAGGLVTLSWHFNNPWTGNDSWDTRKNGSLRTLIRGGSHAYDNWRRQLDTIADALEPLRDAGVVVLWRPLHEMNGGWFWWGADGIAGHESAYKALFRDMFNYLTYNRKLNNLLWVYSTATTWNRTLKNYYPGRGYVDITGIDIYSDDVVTFDSARDYRDLRALGHPMGLTEFGPTIDQATGNYDNRRLVNQVSSLYPDFVYTLSWHSWTDNSSGSYRAIALADNHYTAEAFSDTRVVSLARVHMPSTANTTIVFNDNIEQSIRNAISAIPNWYQRKLLSETYNCRARRALRRQQGVNARHPRICVYVAADQIKERDRTWAMRKYRDFLAR